MTSGTVYGWPARRINIDEGWRCMAHRPEVDGPDQFATILVLQVSLGWRFIG